MSDLTDWIERVTRGASRGAVAHTIGVHNSTYNRQYSTGILDAQYVIAIARQYKVDPLEGLVAGGYLTAAEAGGAYQNTASFLKTVTDAELVAELVRRMRSNNTREEHAMLHAPVSEAEAMAEKELRETRGD
ncbi:hypothetical protein ACRQFN_09255 [Actinotignum sp. GS-2025e]|uniref:hypothetical protein n=1 Tax=unclassified Actinotignum TaxID=2632702 RepID=UPI003F44D532